MKIYRFMSIEEFKNFLNGEQIEGRFAKGKACFLENPIPAREIDPSVKQLTDLTSLDFKSTDFEGQMEELTELISPVFADGNFEGQLKDMEHLTLSHFMSKVRENVTADVLVEFETTDSFEGECDKVIMAYLKYLIEEVQSNGYSMDTLKCVSYQIDLINGFKNGIGIDTVEKHAFESVEQALADLEKATEEKQKTTTSAEREKEFAMAGKIARATINTDTEKKDEAQTHMQQDLQRMQENTQTK